MQLSSISLALRQQLDGVTAYNPALLLDFTSGNQTLDPRITFTRASTATYFNSAGVLTTTGFNLLLYSEQADNAAWVTTTPYTVTANTAISPDGTQSADSVILASGQSSFLSGITKQTVTKAASVVQYTRSQYFKALGATTSVRIYDFGATTTDRAAVIVSLVDGSIVTGASATGNFSGASVAVSDAGNGWWRVALTYTTDAHTSLTVRSFPYVGATQLTGDGTSGLLVWGAQLEAGSAATVYIPTTSATSGAARFDYDPVTLAPKGLLIEESRTNLLTRSIPDAAVPTGYTVGLGTGTYTHTLVPATGSLSGFQNFIRHSQTVSGRSYLTTTVTLAVSTTYTLTVRFNPGTLNVTSGNATVIFISGLTGATGTLSLGASSVPSNGVASITFTTAAAVSANIRIGIGSAADATGVAEFGAWQLEAGAFATSYIPTVASQVTRAADVAVMTGTNFSSWYNQSEGTFSVIYEASQNAFTSYLVASNGVTAQNSIHFDNDSGNMRAVYYSGSSAVATLSLGARGTVGTFNKVASAYKVNDFAASRNAGTVVTDTSGTVPVSLTQLNIGADPSGAAVNVINGHISRIAYYNRRLTNAELQGITS